VTWTIAQQGVAGAGIIQNLSADGICLQLDRDFRVQSGTLLLSLASPEIAVLPAQARLRWFRRLPRQRFEPPRGLLCGCVFVSTSEIWIDWYRKALARQIAAHQSD
jgi:hypothetical protein